MLSSRRSCCVSDCCAPYLEHLPPGPDPRTLACTSAPLPTLVRPLQSRAVDPSARWCSSPRCTPAAVAWVPSCATTATTSQSSFRVACTSATRELPAVPVLVRACPPRSCCSPRGLFSLAAAVVSSPIIGFLRVARFLVPLFSSSSDQVRDLSKRMLNNKLVTKQTGEKGALVSKVRGLAGGPLTCVLTSTLCRALTLSLSSSLAPSPAVPLLFVLVVPSYPPPPPGFPPHRSWSPRPSP